MYKKNARTAIAANIDGYIVEIRYNEKTNLADTVTIRPEDKNNKKPFKISAKKLGHILADYVSRDFSELLNLKTRSIMMTEVERQLVLKSSKDVAEGEEIRVSFKHPMPLEFALAEEVFNKCKADKDKLEITPEDIEKYKDDFSKNAKDYLINQYSKDLTASLPEVSKQKHEN